MHEATVSTHTRRDEMARRRGGPHLFVDSRLATDGLDRLVQPPTEILQYHRSSLLRDRVDEREQQSRFLHTIKSQNQINILHTGRPVSIDKWTATLCLSCRDEKVYPGQTLTNGSIFVLPASIGAPCLQWRRALQRPRERRAFHLQLAQKHWQFLRRAECVAGGAAPR